MIFKLDENLSRRVQEILQEAGHDATTVPGQGLSGISDEDLSDVCKGESRCLITLDLDFADLLRFPPQQMPGIVVMRYPGRVTWAALELLTRNLVQHLKNDSPEGSLWVVEPARIRIRVSSQEADPI